MQGCINNAISMTSTMIFLCKIYGKTFESKKWYSYARTMTSTEKGIFSL
jgi:hypothetical protein